MNQYCATCCKLGAALFDAQRLRAFAAQQVRDVGSMTLIHAHRDADAAVNLARAALAVHEMSCGVAVPHA